MVEQSRRLPTLDEYNRQRQVADEERPLGAGVRCWKCHVEMIFAIPGVVNAGHPPTEWVACPKCREVGLKRV